jgi:drug efflux transport system ATP-binding protein
MIAVRAQDVVKKFRQTTAIQHLDLAVEKGTLAGLIGPDGAGKSTLLRLLIGLLKPTNGRIEVGGFDVSKSPFQVKDRIGYMPQHFSLYGDLTVAENMKFSADLYGVQGEPFIERKKELLKFSALDLFEDRLARNLSGGMQKKLALACNLFHTPDILLLDEPTTGVDPVSRLELWQLLRQLNDKGVTILLTTPYMDEAARCHMVGFIFEGRILVYDTPPSIIASLRDGIAELMAPHAGAIRALRGLPGVKSVHPFGEMLHVVFDTDVADIAAIQKRLIDEQVVFQSLKQIQPSFEDAFLALAQEHSRQNQTTQRERNLN